MIRPYALIGKKNPLLHAVAYDVELTPEGLAAALPLVDRLRATVRVKQGLAIAAPQVGFALRIVVRWDGNALLNPVFDPSTDETVEDLEGCLSLPGRAYRVPRFRTGVLTGHDLQGAEVRDELSGLDARMWQHEIDHLDGVLISDVGTEVRHRSTYAL